MLSTQALSIISGAFCSNIVWWVNSVHKDGLKVTVPYVLTLPPQFSVDSDDVDVLAMRRVIVF